KPIHRPILLARIAAVRKAKEQKVHRDALVRELEEAREIQRGFVPSHLQIVNDFAIAGTVVPCTHIGGDLFTVFPGMGGAHVALVLDVSGHGAAAALVAASIGGELRMLLQSRSLEESLIALHARLSTSASGKYVCLAAVELKGDRAVVINAGLPPVC